MWCLGCALKRIRSGHPEIFFSQSGHWILIDRFHSHLPLVFLRAEWLSRPFPKPVLRLKTPEKMKLKLFFQSQLYACYKYDYSVAIQLQSAKLYWDWEKNRSPHARNWLNVDKKPKQGLTHLYTLKNFLEHHSPSYTLRTQPFWKANKSLTLKNQSSITGGCYPSRSSDLSRAISSVDAWADKQQTPNRCPFGLSHLIPVWSGWIFDLICLSHVYNT